MREKEIRATFDQSTITVYQAYSSQIAGPAVQSQTFVSPFKMERMTWIKPSFLWMMYRSGWATKEGQERVLAIRIKRRGWEWALRNACLSHYVSNEDATYEEWREALRKAPVRVQWDPEKDIYLTNLNYRSIQVGLTGIAVEKYVNEWIESIEDISENCRYIHSLVLNKKIDEAILLLPEEKIYPLTIDIKGVIQAS